MRIALFAAAVAFTWGARANALPSLNDMKAELRCSTFSGYEQALPPVITYWENEKEVPDRIEKVEGDKVTLNIRPDRTLKLLRVDYTPFLHSVDSNFGKQIKGKNIRDLEKVEVEIPPPNVHDNVHPLYLQAHFTVKDAKGAPRPDAVVLFGSGSYDGSPYIVNSDQNGKFNIDCFQEVFGPISVADKDGNEVEVFIGKGRPRSNGVEIDIDIVVPTADDEKNMDIDHGR